MGKLSVIDLAGSERATKSNANFDQLNEAKSINKSLTALGDVISCLSKNDNQHIPYRNSKLTYLMKDYLGGNVIIYKKGQNHHDNKSIRRSDSPGRNYIVPYVRKQSQKHLK